jgi:hypothetical protein
MPPGTRLMGEQERLETLADLKQARNSTNAQLERMPLSLRSVRIAEQKQELENKLTRLERAIETFSRPTVYVAL